MDGASVKGVWRTYDQERLFNQDIRKKKKKGYRVSCKRTTSSMLWASLAVVVTASVVDNRSLVAF
jgi:hypothetical protein